MGIAGIAINIDQPADTERVPDPADIVRLVFIRSGDALYRYILVRVRGNRTLAEDLLQQTCLEAVRHRHPPRTADACEAWLRGIARNLVRRHWRTCR